MPGGNVISNTTSISCASIALLHRPQVRKEGAVDDKFSLPETPSTYIAIDLKSFYASAEAADRNFDPSDHESCGR